MIELNIKPEDIENAVKQAIIESSLGEMIKQTLKDKFQDWNIKKSVNELVDKELNKVIVRLLQEEANTNIMKYEIRKQLSEDIIRGIIGKAIERKYGIKLWLNNLFTTNIKKNIKK